jgi:tRNA (guanine37-N1)-methyltransferase
VPGAISDPGSAHGDSFYDRGLSAPSYTRPPEYRGWSVPEVLLSGDHKRIEAWRAEVAERLTRERVAPAPGTADDSAPPGQTEVARPATERHR